jgi:predicted RNA polymerase sigma factor
MAFGPAEGLELVDSLTSEPSLKSYHLLPSVRGDLLAKLGRFEEASAEFERAASLTRNARERQLLLARASACARGEVFSPRSSGTRATTFVDDRLSDYETITTRTVQ